MIQTPAWSRSWWLFVILFPIGVGWNFPFREIVATCSFFFLVHATVSAENVKPLPSWTRPMVKLGEVSYGVYLIHHIAFIAAKRFCLSSTPTLGNHLFVAGMRLAAGLFSGYLVYRFLEKPFLTRAQKITVPLVKTNDILPAPEKVS